MWFIESDFIALESDSMPFRLGFYSLIFSFSYIFILICFHSLGFLFSPTAPIPLTTHISNIVLTQLLSTKTDRPSDISTPLWSAHLLSSSPSLIQQAHRNYFAAGAQIATTASYQASLSNLRTHLSIPEVDASSLITRSVDLANSALLEHTRSLPTAEQPSRRPRSKPLYVAASLGPYAACLADGSEYTGAYDPLPSPAQFAAFHAPRIAALLAARPPPAILAVETLPSYPELLALLPLLCGPSPSPDAAGSFASWVSFSLHATDAARIADGTPLRTACAAICAADPQAARILAVGVNCAAPGRARDALREMRRWIARPLVVYANSGEGWDAEAREWVGAPAGAGEAAGAGAVATGGGRGRGGDDWEALTRAFWSEGARIVGGCCRTGVGEVGAIARAMGEMEREREGEGEESQGTTG